MRLLDLARDSSDRLFVLVPENYLAPERAVAQITEGIEPVLRCFAAHPMAQRRGMCTMP